MSDQGQVPAPAATPAPAAPSAEPAAAPSPVQAPVQESVLDTELPEGTDHFPRSYVEKLREEAGGSRTALKEWKELHNEFKDHFEGPKELREFLTDLRDPQQFLQMYRQWGESMPKDVLKQVMADLIADEEAPKPDEEDDLDRPMTRREFQEQQEQQRVMQLQAREDREVQSTLGKLKVPKPHRGFVIVAAMQHPEKLGLAERLRRGHADYKKALDEHVASISATDEANRAKTPGSMGGAAPVAGDGEHPKTWEASRAGAKKRLGLSNKADSLNT